METSFFFHPRMVHLPRGLGVVMPLVAGGLLAAWWTGWLPRRAWLVAVLLQAGLVVSGFVAVRTGGAEEDLVGKIVSRRLIHAHEEAGERFVQVAVVVLVVMAIALALRRWGLVVAAVATLGTLVVFYLGLRAGQLGGALVYEHGAAQAYVRAPGALPTSPGEAAKPPQQR